MILMFVIGNIEFVQCRFSNINHSTSDDKTRIYLNLRNLFLAGVTTLISDDKSISLFIVYWWMTQLYVFLNMFIIPIKT